MLFPKKIKFRKWQTRRSKRDHRHPATRGTSVVFGSYGIQAMGNARVTSNQIEAARKTMSRNIKKVGKLWIRIFPDRPYTKKAAEVPMGKGKGDPQGYVAMVYPGSVLFEVDGVPEELARDMVRKAGAKLPVKTKFVSRG